MITQPVCIDSLEKVQRFVHIMNSFNGRFELVSGCSAVNAKSVMGIFSLDLSKPIDLDIHADGKDLDLVTRALTPYRIDEG